MRPATDITREVTHRRHNRTAGPAVLASLLVSLLLVGLLVVSVSRAAFSDTTQNTSNSLATGTVDLVDDDSGSAMFSVTGMIPGSTSQKCILVTYQGTVANPAAVKLYSGGYTDSGTLGSWLRLTVDEGSGGNFASCAGFTSSSTIVSNITLSSFNTTHTNYANGAGVWDPSTTPQSRTYRFTFTLDSATPSSQQGQSVTALTFTWEVQS